MMPLSQAGAALSAAGLAWRIRGDPAIVPAGVSIDSRTLNAGALYVALRGERFDGHDFAADARDRGAVAMLVERELPVQLPQLVVADTREALARIAAAWRAQFKLPVIAVAGSNGKTTTTQMIAAILAQAFASDAGVPTWFATRGNKNNDIGVPLMLLELRAGHRAAVFELGMNHPGEIARLSDWVRPDVALVTNAQREHQEFLDSVEATARENGAAILALPAGGTAVFAADDGCAPIWRGYAGRRKVLDFALRGPAAVGAELRLEPQTAQLQMRTPAGPIRADLNLGGEHNARNALAAAAAALAIAIAPADIAAGLESFRPVAGRGTRRVAYTGAIVVDESYNANPDSVRAAIELLAGFPGERILVFGDMAEVGSRGAEFHREIGLYARQRGIDHLLGLGPQSQQAVQAFGAGARHFGAVEDLIAALLALLAGAAAPEIAPAGRTVLVKGSRSMRMERVVQALAPEPPAPEGVPPRTPSLHA